MPRPCHRALVFAAILSALATTACTRSRPENRISRAKLDQTPDLADSRFDGTPDFLRLDTNADQAAFRRWFTFLAEIQYFTPAKDRPAEITDCAALLRYAYRDALRDHDAKWSAASRLPLLPASESVSKYSYPHTPLGPALFRVRAGPWSPSDLHSGAFAQFADAESIQRWNTFFISRDLDRAQSGDLLFYRRQTDRAIFHSMIFIGRSQVTPGPTRYAVYDTGPEGARNGEIKRLSVDELLHFPDPQWQPRSTNPVFLGVYRWSILNSGS
ncbi:MAG TPA: DUF1175 family protein [Terriglobales bacterium]|nr:DUF1175 family protein [Terriglobales bacterium]